MVPDDMRASSDMVIWALKLHRTHQEAVQTKVDHYNELEEKTRESEEARLRLKDDMDEIETDVKNLEDIRPVAYIAFKGRVGKMGARIASKCVIS